jgi:hypothetical protein
MSIEETLSSIDQSLKSLLSIALTGAAAPADLGKPDAPAPKASRKKTETSTAPAIKLLAGDPEGTRYFLIEKHNTVARVLAGEAAPSIDGMVEIDGDVYAAKKEEFAKKSLTAEQTANAAAASTAAATASTASSSEVTVSFKQVVDKLIELSKDTRPGKGRDALTAFLAKHKVAKVPALEAFGKHATLLAEVEALLAPDAAVEEDVFA